MSGFIADRYSRRDGPDAAARRLLRPVRLTNPLSARPIALITRGVSPVAEGDAEAAIVYVLETTGQRSLENQARTLGRDMEYKRYGHAGLQR